MRPSSRGALGTVFASVMLCAVSVGLAQELPQVPPPGRPVDPGRRVFIDVNQVRPIEVLRDVAPVVGARLELSPDVPDTLVTLRMWNVRASTALDAVCDIIGCRWRVDRTLLRVDPAPPPPAPSRTAEAWARLKSRLEGDQWNFVNTSLHDISAALARELGESVIFDGADPGERVTVDLRGETMMRALGRLIEALGWDSLGGVDFTGGAGRDGLVLRLRGYPPARSEKTKPDVMPAASANLVYKSDDPGVKPPVLLSERKPSYTAEAMRAKIQGKVVLSAVVDLDGSVTDIEVLTSLEPGLDAQAVVAARQWRFRPGTKDGKPVRVRVTLEMTFTLRK